MRISEKRLSGESAHVFETFDYMMLWVKGVIWRCS